jgi:hypothetical protein
MGRWRKMSKLPSDKMRDCLKARSTIGARIKDNIRHAGG